MRVRSQSLFKLMAFETVALGGLGLIWFVFGARLTEAFSPVVVYGVGIGLAVLIELIFALALIRIIYPPDYRAARAKGLSGTARILEVKITGSSRRTGGTRERLYELRALVENTGRPTYEATLHEYFHPAAPPPVGATVPIKYLPSKPEVVVLAR